uniref:Ovule protein n=1 Tax=Strongyloides venezuelensis TaxID=75913 RepID=A0A0K0FRD7_STRVS
MVISNEALKVDLFSTPNLLLLSEKNGFSQYPYVESFEEEKSIQPSSIHTTPSNFSFESLMSTPTPMRRIENSMTSNK